MYPTRKSLKYEILYLLCPYLSFMFTSFVSINEINVIKCKARNVCAFCSFFEKLLHAMNSLQYNIMYEGLSKSS